MQDRLIFLLSPPRAGSTLLMRVLNATSHIYSRPEPHLIPPLAHLGFWDVVDKAPYDQLQSQQAVREFVADLPGGESDYWDACRAYTDVLYGRMLQQARGGERYFLDKTPANALVLPVLTKIYPRARYIVLTRHPAAVFCSFANSFFEGDFEAAEKFNPILSRYVPAMADFLRQDEVPFLQVGYEELVAEPEAVLERISSHLGIPFEPEALNYGRTEVEGRGLGDPIGVKQHDRPVATGAHKWAAELAADQRKLDAIARQLAIVPDADLATWGFPVATLWEPVESADPTSWRKSKQSWTVFRLQRAAFRILRRNIRHNWLGRLVTRVRAACDVLLRG